MLYQKKGETHEQFNERLIEYNKKLEKAIAEALRLNVDTKLTNSRTNKTFEQEASQMFTSLALIEQAIRVKDYEVAKKYAQGALEQQGYNIAEIYENKCLKDGAYTGEQK